MNTSHLSVEEIIQYLSSGVITEMCAEDVLRVIEELLLENGEMFDEGHKAGYSEAEQDFKQEDSD